MQRTIMDMHWGFILLCLICCVKFGATNRELIDAQDNDGNSALHISVQHDRMEIAELLVIRGGANVNAQNAKLQTPLHMAVDFRRIRIMKFLVRREANVSLQDENGNSPLHLALLKNIENSTESENEIESHCGSQFDEESRDGKSFAYMACFLVAHGANLNIQNSNGQTPLNLCNKLKSCDKLNPIYRNWDIDTKDNEGNTALHICAVMNRIEISEILIEHGANMDLRNFKLQTALHIAVDLRRIEIMEKLVSKGCNLTLPDRNGDTALHIAINHYLQELENFPQSDNLCDEQSETSIANLRGYPYIVCYLVQHGADWHTKNKDNKSPLRLCPGLGKCITGAKK